jgi:hypothetical protein
LKVNDERINTRNTNVSPGEKERISFEYAASSPGQYRVDLNGLTGTLDVVKPPEFQVGSLEIVPAVIVVGKTVTINAEVKNTGEIDGNYSAKLSVDGKEIVIKDVKVGAGTLQKVSFSYNVDSTGPHTFTVGSDLFGINN